MNTILVVDDDKRINELLCEIFTMEGYNVVSCLDGEQAIKEISENPGIDLMILDIMMPIFDGWEVLDYVKAHFDIKVLILSALVDEQSEVRGIRDGADDYVFKPFKRAVLLERVRRLITEKHNENSCDLICDGLVLSQSKCKVFIDSEEIKITIKEYQLLLLLMKNAPMVLSRDNILSRIWGLEYDGNDRTIDTHIKMLRHSLGGYGLYIRTVRGTGYSFDSEVDKR